ncbi:diguanylate cyclase [Piscinibacter sp. Jin2]|uniref:diguanylate cyclase n=1 Tax=Aquariibacter lacus TaxID=2801332 RepID=A0A9X0XEJ6_9BURK|nr:GGDEF domain-containing protein [Piscinibacter lacus]MBL0719531.1 diguanylate cyclase [Piscinibacter lacus]
MNAPEPRPGAAAPVAVLAKATLRRLALERLEPTPENYARAYAAESGQRPPEPARAEGPDGEAWAGLIERTLRALERSDRGWTAARRKDSLQRVLGGSRSDAARLHQRLTQLLARWDEAPAGADEPPGPREAEPAARPAAELARPLQAPIPIAPAQPAGADSAGPQQSPAPTAGPQAAAAQPALPKAADRPADPPAAWPALVDSLAASLDAALPADDAGARALADRLQQRLQAARPPDAASAGEVALLCEEARRLIAHRLHGHEVLTRLCRGLSESLIELAEDESWARGQAQAMRQQFETGLAVRGLRQLDEMLATTRACQQRLQGERRAAREALKASIRQMLSDLASLGQTSGRYADSLDRHAEAIASADTLDGLAGRVREMVAESRAVQSLVAQTRDRLQAEQARAEAMQDRVRTLEDEIRRLGDEVSTDPLTQIANRRGLMRAFDRECARLARAAHEATAGAGVATQAAAAAANEAATGASADLPPAARHDAPADPPAEPLPLAVGLLDIDNFKRLNDRLGHASGDAALQFLARHVTRALRPQDTLARYGGEEFVVLLPATPVDEAQRVLSRLQRLLSAELFTSDGPERIFVTFSAGVTAHRPGDPLDAALARADVALYEAKRTGKNRTCVG